MDIDANSNYFPMTTISNGYTSVIDNSYNAYEDFLNSIYELKEKDMLMSHLPSDITLASRLYRGYLTDEELQEKQYEGRFWCLSGPFLYILADDETLLVIDTFGGVEISGRDKLPNKLQGRHYYDKY